MDFIKYLRNASFEIKYLILVLSVISGITGGALLILYPNAALHIFEKGKYLYYLLILPPVSCIFLISKRLSQSKTAEATEHALENQILTILNTIRQDELADFEKRDRADIYLSIVNASAITQAATKSIDAFTHNITLIIGWFYIYFFLAPFLGWLIVIWRLIYVMFRESFQKIIKSILIEELKEQKDLFHVFQNHLFGFKELKFHRKKNEDIFNNYLCVIADRIKSLRIKARFYASELMLFYIVSILLLMGSCVFVFSASFSSETALKAVIMILFMMKTDILVLNSIPTILEGNAAQERLQRLFDSTSKRSDAAIHPSGRDHFKEIKSIVLEDIRYAYPAKDNEKGFTLEIDNLSIQSGQILFIVGGNGSGKSTLVNILTGLYRPDSGKIKIDDHVVQMAKHRYLFSTVFADFHLFDKIYGIDDIEDKKVFELLKTMDLSQKVQYKKGEFNTLKLSAGQRKRLALIVTLLEDKPVFVFDEWAADQDPEFRRFFYEQLLPMFKKNGKTVIAITHDDHYFQTADIVIRMEEGKIVQRLTPFADKKEMRLFMGKTEDVSVGLLDSDEAGQTSAVVTEHLDEREIDRPEKKSAPKGLIQQLRQVTEGDGEPIKKILFLLCLVSFALVAAPVVILSASRIPPGASTLIPFIQFMILVTLYVMSFRRLGRHFYQAVETRILDIRIQVMDRVRKTDLKNLEQMGPERIYTKLTSDIKAIADTSNTILMTLLGGVRTIMIYLYIAFLYYPAFLIMACLTGLGGMMYAYNHSRLMKIFTHLRDQERNMFESVNHLITGFKELRLNSKKSDDFYEKSIKSNSGKLREIKLGISKYYINNYTIAYALFEGILLSVILILPYFEPAQKVLPIVVALVLTMPVNQIIDHYSQFHMAYMSFSQLIGFEDQIKDLYQEAAGKDEAFDIPSQYEKIAYQNIYFRYRTSDGHPFSIGPLDITFKPGETVFITGGNGSGKSTLLKLITGLYPVDSGRIQVNEKDADIRRHQELFSAVFSDFHLFDRLYGMENINETKLNELLTRFHLKNRVQYCNGKFGNLDLSTGQKKRLALVVTILENKPIVIFDEWAADQDPYFKAYFYKTLIPELKSQGKTVIAVTHDDRYFASADRVIRMEYGLVSNIINY